MVVDLDPRRPRPPAARLLLGHFVEHLGRCVEDGLWLYSETTRPLLADPPLERVPRDLFEAIRALAPPVIRYPGGCFADTYHWRDGVGPRDTRPTRQNRAWGGIKNVVAKVGPKERNHFGTDEFLALCERCGATPYLNVNFGTGTPREAANWVEYCNGSLDTYFGRLRANYGHRAPHAVPFWGIANEIYGWWEKGYCKTPEAYAERYLAFARAMRAVDPSIRLLAVGWDRSDWNRPLLARVKGFVDYLTIHIYQPQIGLLANIFGSKPLPETPAVYHAMLNAPAVAEDLIQRAAADIEAVFGDVATCKVAFDEWNIWYHFKQVYRADKPHYCLRDGLWSACMVNAFIRNARAVGMANFAQLVNCIGMILTYPEGVVLTPHYFVFQMYGEAWQPQALPVEVQAPVLASEPFGKKIPALARPMLDASALGTPENARLSLFLVNKHVSASLAVEVALAGLEGAPDAASLAVRNTTLLTHPDPHATNTREAPEVVTLARDALAWDPASRTIELPPHSASVVVFARDESA